MVKWPKRFASPQAGALYKAHHSAIRLTRALPLQQSAHTLTLSLSHSLSHDPFLRWCRHESGFGHRVVLYLFSLFNLPPSHYLTSWSPNPPCVDLRGTVRGRENAREWGGGALGGEKCFPFQMHWDAPTLHRGWPRGVGTGQGKTCPKSKA
jgi:hypothetical protein